MASSVQFDNASVTLGTTKALRSVTVGLPSGQVIGLLGPSGAGKTTLMRVIIGHQPLDSGQAMVLEQRAGAACLRSMIGYMPQAMALYRDLTVLENLRYFATMLAVDKQAVHRAIADVELGEQAHQMVGTLSGGQKARVSLATALLGNPRLLVLDEPTVGIDPVLRLKIWQLFHHLAGAGTTLLVSSHVMDEASRCDDLLLIRRGRLLAHGSPAELLAETHTDTIEESFLSLVKSRP